MARPRTERPILDGDHDTMTEDDANKHYNRGCGHDKCRAAAAARARENRAWRKANETPTSAPIASMPAIGAVRRLQALHHCGYDHTDIASALKWTPELALSFITDPPNSIRYTTHTAIVELFTQRRDSPVLASARPGTVLYSDARAAMLLADERGWAGPYDWDDIDADPKPPRGRQPHDFDADGNLLRAAHVPTKPAKPKAPKKQTPPPSGFGPRTRRTLRGDRARDHA